MSPLAKIGIGVIGTLGVLAAVIAVRTANYHAPLAFGPAQASSTPVVPLDLDRAAQHIAAAVRIRTVSHQDAEQNDWREWERLHTWLVETYPAVHARMTRELVASSTLGGADGGGFVPYAGLALLFNSRDAFGTEASYFSLPLRLGLEARLAPEFRLIAELQLFIADDYNDHVGFATGVNLPF